MTCCCTVCMTLARKRSLSRSMPYFHISLVMSEMRWAGKRTSLAEGGVDELAAGMRKPVMMAPRMSSSSGFSSSSNLMISSAIASASSSSSAASLRSVSCG